MEATTTTLDAGNLVFPREKTYYTILLNERVEGIEPRNHSRSAARSMRPP